MGLSPDVKELNYSNKQSSNDERDEVKELVMCLKDYKNAWAKKVVDESNNYCKVRGAGLAQLQNVYLCPTPCRLLICNPRDFGEALKRAHANLLKDGFLVSLC